jgi:uncharacterized protein (TIGR02001 family)
MKNITLITLFVGALAFITSASAAVSGNLGVTTDYVWRGASQGDGVALSGGMDYAGEGFYAGIWTSSLGDDALGADQGYETDFYIGTEINGFDVGLISYEYTKKLNSDFQEFYVGYSYSGFDLFYAQNVDDSDADYFSVSYGLPEVIAGVSSSLTYGDSGAGVAFDEDYLQLDIAYGDLTLSVLDTDAGTSTALSYSWAL